MYSFVSHSAKNYTRPSPPVFHRWTVKSGDSLLREMAVQVTVLPTARNTALERERQGQRQSADFFQRAKRVKVYTCQD